MGGGFFLRCMGYPGLYGADGRPYKLKVRKHLALLVYLALEDHAQRRRDTLVELLWSGAPPECGRHSLSMALSVLRGILGAGAIRATSAHVRLERGVVTLDLEQVERGEVLGDAVTPPLEVDGFLADFDIEDAPGFMHWRDRQQARLLPMLQAGLLTLADQARRPPPPGPAARATWRGLWRWPTGSSPSTRSPKRGSGPGWRRSRCRARI